MDPATIATGVLTILTPYLLKGAKEFTNVVGEAAYQKATSLFQDLKRRWTGDKEAATTLELFEQKPSRHAEAVKEILVEKLNADSEMAHDYSKRLEDLGPILDIVQKMTVGKNVVGLEARELRKGQVSVTQEIENADGVTGIKLDSIG
jgi:hypothetical protein